MFCFASVETKTDTFKNALALWGPRPLYHTVLLIRFCNNNFKLFACFTLEGDCTGSTQGWITLASVTTMALNATTCLETVEKYAIRFPLRCLRTQCSGRTGIGSKWSGETSSMVVMPPWFTRQVFDPWTCMLSTLFNSHKVIECVTERGNDKKVQSRYSELHVLPFYCRKPEKNSLLRWRNTKEIITNYKRTKMAKDGED